MLKWCLFQFALFNHVENHVIKFGNVKKYQDFSRNFDVL